MHTRVFLILFSVSLMAGMNVSAQSILRVEQKVPDSYIVVFKPKTSVNTAQNLVASYGGLVKQVYTVVNGFAADLTESEAESLSKNPNVAFVEEDGYSQAIGTQNNAPWGLDRITQRDRPLNSNYSFTTTGLGVNVYVLDSGIRVSHAGFGGRAVAAFDSVGDGRDGIDCNGHGTHVAGTIGSTTYGVAKGARLYAVRVLNCRGAGSNSGVIAGIDWVAKNHIKPAVANLSLGGRGSSAIDAAVRSAIAAGVTFIVAAGNENQDACNISPARVPAAITVGSTTRNDARSSFSNYGRCVDIFAPGSDITSLFARSDSSTATLSGTSMAAPHVAGVAAMYLEANYTATPAEVAQAILGNATTNRLTGIGPGSPNRLLYSLFF
jgi:aqualysin 1